MNHNLTVCCDSKPNHIINTKTSKTLPIIGAVLLWAPVHVNIKNQLSKYAEIISNFSRNNKAKFNKLVVLRIKIRSNSITIGISKTVSDTKTVK